MGPELYRDQLDRLQKGEQQSKEQGLMNKWLQQCNENLSKTVSKQNIPSELKPEIWRRWVYTEVKYSVYTKMQYLQRQHKEKALSYPP